MFKAVNYLLYEKDKQELDVELLESFNPIITTKTFSYYGMGAYCNPINETLNMYSGIFKTKEDQFKFFDHMIPKLIRKKSDYIKKPKVDNLETIKIPIPEFLSKRELAIFENQNK